MVVSGVVTLVLGLLLKATMGWRIDKDAETAGIDQFVHAESAYDLTAGSGGRFAGAFAEAGVSKPSAPSITEGASA
jgi:Amt family ammonium transporter